MRVMDILKEQTAKARAELKGEGRSVARMIKQARDIPRLAKVLEEHTGHGPRKVRPTDVNIRMADGKPMTFQSDGSLRHMLGSKPGKAARKALKRMRQAKRRAAK